MERIKCLFEAEIFPPKTNLGRAFDGHFPFSCLEKVECWSEAKVMFIYFIIIIFWCSEKVKIRFEANIFVPKIILGRSSGRPLSILVFRKSLMLIWGYDFAALKESGQNLHRTFLFSCLENDKNRFEAKLFLPKINFGRTANGPFHSLGLERAKCWFKAKLFLTKINLAEPPADALVFWKDQIPIWD